MRINNIKSMTLWGICIFSMAVFAVSAYGTALDDYVSEPDDNYSYSVVSSSFQLIPPTWGYVLRLRSQAWRDETEVDQVIWEHWVTVTVPLFVAMSDTALVLINGGDTNDPAPAISDDFRLLAAGTGSVIVEMTAVPNQPLQFMDETTQRSEDEIIAYTWDKFLQGGDVYWPLQLPMTKSVVRCMDAVQEFAYDAEGVIINNFVVTGGSKRGWTAWLTAAVDTRVAAIAPIVSDLLNMKRSFAHHWGAYGFWAEALAPYEEMGIFEWFDSVETTELLEIVDPFEYLERLDMPKFIINSAGDDFFVMDSVQFYIDELVGESYLRHVPNTDHYLTDAYDDVLECTVAYYDAFLNGYARPEFSWTLEEDGSIRVQTFDVPKGVYLWQASNTQSRDFRMVTIGPTWASSVLPDEGEGVYTGQVAEPVSGWTAFFVELVYESPFQGADSYDYHFTTEMRVIPEMLPFEADLNRDTVTDVYDLVVLGQSWLSGNVYRDISPRGGGDGVVNLHDFGLLAEHWLE